MYHKKPSRNRGFFIFDIFQIKLYICTMEYENLRLDVLTKLIDERGITCKNKKEVIIEHLKMDDEGKYIRETTYEKEGGRFLVGIDLKNHSQLVQMGKLVEKKEAHPKGLYASDRIYFISNQKLI